MSKTKFPDVSGEFSLGHSPKKTEKAGDPKQSQSLG